MADVSLSEAISLFDNSDTARGAKGSVGKWPLVVIEKLRYLHAVDEIGFVLPANKKKQATNKGSYLADRAGADLRVNPAYVKRVPEKHRLAAVSLVLVHEGTHAILDWSDGRRLFEELMARKVPIYYYRELLGPGVINVLTGKKVWLGSPDVLPHLEEQSALLERDQLVDYTLDVKTYQDDSYVDEKWIKDNLGLWGGLRNRWASTRRLYVKKLLPVATDPYYAVAILEILESIQTNDEWNGMMDAIKKKSRDGSLRTLQIAFESLLGSKAHTGRIASLQRKWGTQLTELR
jgi:hypothetical protein